MKPIAQALLPLLLVVAAASSVSEDDGSILISPSVYELQQFPNDALASQSNPEETAAAVDDDTEFSSRMGQAETPDPRPRHPPRPPGIPGRDRGRYDESAEEDLSPMDKSRGIFSYKTKTHYTETNIPSKHHQGPPIPHLGPAAYQLPKGPPPAPRGWGGPPPHQKGWGGPPPHHKGWGGPPKGWGGPPSHHGHPKVPHYVKYWEQNKAPHHHKPQKKKQGWKVYSKPNPFAPGYWVDLAERLADGVGLLPEYGKQEHKVGPHKHGKYHFKGITLHNGFFTEVL